MNLVTLPTNYQFVNLAGQRFGQLVVLCYAGKTRRIRSGKPFNGKSRWLCRCDCGNLAIVNNTDVKQKSSQSCGCLKEIKTSERQKTHGMTHSPTYRSWAMMIQRATNPNFTSAKDYYLRGITVCDRWRKFENFLTDMGVRPRGTTLDRIDVNGNYEPSNCRWATSKEQSRNQRSNRIAVVNGEKRIATDIAQEYGVNFSTIISRMNRGWETPLTDHELSHN